MSKFGFKVELHVHLDGSIRPETILEISKSRGIHLPHENTDQFKSDVVISEPVPLQEVLRVFGVFMPVVAGCPKAIERIAYEFCEDCAKHNLKYVEARYSPHLLSNSIENPEYAKETGDLSPAKVVDIVCRALERGSHDFGITVNTILCGMTHRPDWSVEEANLCKEYKSRGVVGIDLAGQDFEPGKDPSKCLHKHAFKIAYEAGIHRTVHAGENGSVQGVREAIEHMYAERIGHGYKIFDDEDLYQKCLREKIHFEVCPQSSVQTMSVPTDLSKHPLHRFVKDGANFSINTDDPVVLDNNIDEDYDMVRKMGVSDEAIIKSIFNAARSCFAAENEKNELIQDLISFYGNY